MAFVIKKSYEENEREFHKVGGMKTWKPFSIQHCQALAKIIRRSSECTIWSMFSNAETTSTANLWDKNSKIRIFKKSNKDILFRIRLNSLKQRLNFRLIYNLLSNGTPCPDTSTPPLLPPSLLPPPPPSLSPPVSILKNLATFENPIESIGHT